MLDPKSGIASVTLQQTGEKGLDDVVVRFTNGSARFMQVKHTRAEDTLTFGDLVMGEDGEPPLLRQIATAWNTEASRAAGECEAWLVTNRAAGRRRSAAKGTVPIARPPLDEFLSHLGKEIASATTLGGLSIPTAWQDAWTEEWLPQLDPLGTDARKLQFMRGFQVCPSEEGLEELGERLIEKLAAMFALDRGTALRLRALLDSALRMWTTSLRGSAQAITREVAYEKLCLVADVTVGEHDLPPPAPFFGTRIPVGDDIASLLVSRAEPVVFVMGEPGSGKTALLSSLANRRDPVIDARYHAYRPITPENQLLPADAGRTTSARALWSDLLLQIRPLARGQLAQLQVPVHAASLSVDDHRAHVLRLANALGERQERPFVIAIDGIDHAARAGAATESFLTSLVPPGQVPSHVAFLIGGQPPEGYASYPTWLRAPTSGVRRIDIPSLSLDDTLDLVRARLPESPPSDQENAARDVWQRCQGHTLSTVFAVEEAVLLAEDLSRLATHLDARQLASGIEAYYNGIWSSATRVFPLPATSVRLAACLCLMPVRATPATIRDTLGADEGAAVNWGDLLRKLRPLVVEDSEEFRVVHNDVRVFLHGLLQADPSLYRDCASRLADHLMSGEDAAARHAAAQNLLGVAGRPADQAAVFTPAYVLEGHAIGRSLDTLTEQGLVAADALAAVGPDWNVAHGVATGLRTLEQLRASLGWRNAEDAPLKVAGGTVATKPAERRVPLRGDWNPAVLTATLDDIADLCALGERPRAEGAFQRWFDGLSPADIALASGARPEEDADHAAQEALRSLMAKLGEVSVAVGALLPPSQGAGADGVEADFASGLLAAAVDCADSRDFGSALRRVMRFYFHDAQKLLTRLVEARAWMRFKRFLRSMTVREDHPWPYRLQVAAAAALIDDAKLREAWVAPLLSERASTIRGSTSFSHGMDTEVQQLTVMAWTAFLLGLEDPTRDASAIREEIEKVYRTTQRDDRNDVAISQALHAAALLGSFVATTRDAKPRAVHVEPQVVARTVEVLMTAAAGKTYLLPLGFPIVAASLVRGIAECSLRDAEVGDAVRDVLTAHLRAGFPPNVFLETTWRTLAGAGHRVDLVAYADLWVGAQGQAWNEAPADRHDIVRRLAVLLDEVGESERAAAARSRLPWADIGYTGHKEYVLRQPLEWFEALAAQTPSSWQDEGLRLFALSREASRTGDNRLSWEIEGEVLTAACIDGPSSIARLTCASQSALEPGDRAIVSGLIGMTERVSVDRNDVLAVWAFSTGQLCWQVDADRRRLVEVREALVSAAQRMGATDLPDSMSNAAPAEFACEPDKDGAKAAPTRDITSLAHLRVDEAMRLVCDSRDWRGVAAVLARIVAERPTGAPDAIALAWSTLATRPERVWWFDGAGPAYRAIFPLLTPAERWDGVRRAVTSREYDVPVYRTNMLTENLDDLCRLAAITDGREAVQRGLRRLLDMHELWLSGGGKLAHLAQVPLANDAPASSGWRPLFVDLLFQLIAFDEQTYVQAALRGLDRLFAIDAALYAQAVALAGAAEPEVRRRFLFIAEALACRKDADDVRAWLACETASPQLDVALSAWAALRSGRRALGQPEPEWPPPDREAPLVVPVARPLLMRPPTRKGLHTSVGRASTTVFDQLHAASGDDVDDLRSELAASIRDDAPRRRPRRTRGVHVGDMVPDRASDAEMDRLFALLRVRERQGRFANTPVSRLAQAIVPFSDPFIFLLTPRPCSTADSWPVDDQLDALVLSSPVVVGEKLAAAMEADVDPSVRMIAGVIRTFSHKRDVMVSVDHVVPLGSDHSDDQRPSILNGRAALAFEAPGSVIAHPGARDQEWLTQAVGGLLPFVDATLDFFPGRVWRDRLSWEPNAHDPLAWTREGRRVAWFERVKGPVRHIYPGDFVYRQPTVARWLCLGDEWKRIADVLGLPRRRVRAKCATHREP